MTTFLYRIGRGCSPLAMLAIIAGCSILPPELPTPPVFENRAQIDRYLEAVVTAGDPPGLSVVVVHEGATVYERGFGLADGPREIFARPETIYQFWSLTKAFTATAILQLEERGLLEIDDPVTQHLPFFRVQYANETDDVVRIRHLLGHSSGLPDVGPEILGWIHFEDDPPLDQTDLIRRKLPEFSKLEFAPGAEARYSNPGYMLLAAIIEAKSGLAYSEYVAKRILEPLRMRSSGFAYPDAFRETEAAGSHPDDLMKVFVSFYVDLDRAIREEHKDRYWFERIYSDQQGATGLIGSVRDLARFMKALLPESSSASPLLSSASLRKMRAPLARVAGSPVAYVEDAETAPGWFRQVRDGRLSLSHGGAGASFVGMMRIYPEERLGIAVLANSTYLGRSMGVELVDALAGMDWDRAGGP